MKDHVQMSGAIIVNSIIDSAGFNGQFNAILPAAAIKPRIAGSILRIVRLHLPPGKEETLTKRLTTAAILRYARLFEYRQLIPRILHSKRTLTVKHDVGEFPAERAPFYLLT